MTQTKQRSELIDELFAAHGTPPGVARASVHPCEGAKHHSPVPLTTVCYSPHPGRLVWLCPTCLSKLECYLHLSAIVPDEMSWQVMQQFGNAIRMLGQEIVARERSDG